MVYDEFKKEVERVSNLPLLEQENYYLSVIEEYSEQLDVFVAAHYNLGKVYYFKGDFSKAKQILIKIIMEYQKYPHIYEVLSCFNLLGVIYYYDGLYVLSRYYNEKALEIAIEYDEKLRYTYEYNNISIGYMSENKYEEALVAILKAKEYLPYSDEYLGAYVYLNLAVIYMYLHRLDESYEAYQIGVNKYKGREIIEYDYDSFAMQLSLEMGDHKKYLQWRKEILSKLDQMDAPEYIDSCFYLFECSLIENDFDACKEILTYMDHYMETHSKELRIGLLIETKRYKLGEKLQDKEIMFQALEKKNTYYEKVYEESQIQSGQDMDRYFDMSDKLQQSYFNELKANHAKTEFLSNMSHDIRTPINGVLGMLQVIRSNPNDEERVQDAYNKIWASSEHLLSLVNDILDMSKLESDSFDIENKSFDLNQVLDQVKLICLSQIEKNQLTIKQERNIIHKQVFGSAIYLEKILLNLFSNAVKYNKYHGSIYTCVNEIGEDGENITLEFITQDTGIGMSKDFIENKLFTTFAKETTRQDSTGLGMAIVHELIKKMNGTIEVESEVDVGTTFRVLLPFKIDVNETQKVHKQNETKDLSNLNILVVEDNDLNMEIIRFMLEHYHANIVEAKNGIEAVNLIKEDKHSFDIILMDLMMPVMDGFQAAIEIRKFNKQIPILAMSANAYAQDVKKCLEVGMIGHISKPLYMEDLLEKINEIIKK